MQLGAYAEKTTCSMKLKVHIVLGQKQFMEEAHSGRISLTLGQVDDTIARVKQILQNHAHGNDFHSKRNQLAPTQFGLLQSTYRSGHTTHQAHTAYDSFQANYRSSQVNDQVLFVQQEAPCRSTSNNSNKRREHD